MNSQLGGQNSNLSLQEQQTIRMMQAAMESCVVKTAMSGAAGITKSVDLNHQYLTLYKQVLLWEVPLVYSCHRLNMLDQL